MKGKHSLEKNPEPEESFVSTKFKLFSLFQLIKAALARVVVSSYHSWLPQKKKKNVIFCGLFFYFPASLSATTG